MNLLEEYKENEELNYHSENVVLLAEKYGDALTQRVARMSLERMNRKGYSDQKLSHLAYVVVLGLYSKLANNEETQSIARDKFNEYYGLNSPLAQYLNQQ